MTDPYAAWKRARGGETPSVGFVDRVMEAAVPTSLRMTRTARVALAVVGVSALLFRAAQILTVFAAAH